MKTLIIFEQFTEELNYFILEGDYSRLHGVQINSGENQALEDELSDLIYNQDGTTKIKLQSFDKPMKCPEHDVLVVCGFLP